MTKPIQLVGISGSLRETSYNTALLREVAELLPGEVDFVLAPIDDLPLYNADLTDVPAATRLQDAIREADGVLIATPEYNYGVPGPLKNAIDWASRPAYRSPFAGMPVGILGATGSAVGTARAQGQLKQILLGMLALPFPWPEFLLGAAKSKFEDGRLVDAVTLEFLREFLDGFLTFVERNRT